MDRMDTLQERSEFEHPTETLAAQTRAGAPRQYRLRGIIGCLLVLSILSLALPVEVQAQTSERRIPISSCTSSIDILLLMGIGAPESPTAPPTIVCPFVDEDSFPKSTVDVLVVSWFSRAPEDTVRVRACSQPFNNPHITCNIAKETTGHLGEVRFRFTITELAAAWGPGHENDFAWVFISINNDRGGPPRGNITGISLFRD